MKDKKIVIKLPLISTPALQRFREGWHIQPSLPHITDHGGVQESILNSFLLCRALCYVHAEDA